MFIKKDLRKIPTILDEAVDCYEYEASLDENDENQNANQNETVKTKRTKREKPLRMLRLGRRKQEFEGCVRVLCQPSHAPKLKHLEVLNLYDCDIHDLTGFGSMFEAAAPNLETLNLGRNPLSKGIPDEFSKVQSLKHLWLDDCQLQGALPKALLHLPNLESLRLPNNRITHLEFGGIDTNRECEGEEFEFDMNDDDAGGGNASKVIPLTNLKILCLDRNLLGGSHQETTADETPPKTSEEGDSTQAMDEDPPASSTHSGENSSDAPNDNANAPNGGDATAEDRRSTCLPSNLAEWAPNLEECFLRHNHLTRLGVHRWPSTLRILQVSSNQLTSLDELVGEHRSTALTHLYANGNRLASLPQDILKDHPRLERLVVSHNPPLSDLPRAMWQRLEDDRNSDQETTLQILWQPNPNLRAPWAKDDDSEKKDTKMHVC